MIACRLFCVSPRALPGTAGTKDLAMENKTRQTDQLPRVSEGAQQEGHLGTLYMDWIGRAFA